MSELDRDRHCRLRTRQGWAGTQIAEELGVTSAAVSVRLKRMGLDYRTVRGEWSLREPIHTRPSVDLRVMLGYIERLLDARAGLAENEPPTCGHSTEVK